MARKKTATRKKKSATLRKKRPNRRRFPTRVARRSDDERTSLLTSVVHELSLVRSLDQIIDIVRKAARRIAQSDGATFILRDENRCYYVDEDAIEPLWKGQKFPMENCVSGWSMSHKQTVVIPDIYRDPRVPVDAYRPTFVKSMAMVPIRTSAPLGAIGVYWAKQRVPGENEIAMLQAMADTVSVAIENVQLYDRLEKQIGDLESAHQAKDEFLMTLSHELRTPLTSICGWAEQLEHEAAGSSETLKKGLSTIVKNAQLQSRIVEDLLDSSRILSGKLVIDRIPVDLFEIAEAAYHSILPMAAAKGISIEKRFPTERSKAMGDPSRLQQAMTSILSNAVKFSPERSKIGFSVVDGPSWVKISIKDSGAGIDPAFMPRMFDRFSQADSTTTRERGGLGLGLSIARYIIEAHGGALRAESAGKGQGAEFVIQLPVLSAARQAQLLNMNEAPKSEETNVLRGLRILAIDDDPDSRELIQYVLAKNGAEVATADGAQAGLAEAQSFSPDLVICDLSMPIEDGYSFIRRLRSSAEERLRTLKAIAFSAFADLEHESQALQAGFDFFLAKPLDSRTLVDSILRQVRDEDAATTG